MRSFESGLTAGEYFGVDPLLNDLNDELLWPDIVQFHDLLQVILHYLLSLGLLFALRWHSHVEMAQEFEPSFEFIEIFQ